jgi:hypothetical protein
MIHMLDIRENIEDYLMVYHYASIKYKDINHIKIFNGLEGAHISFFEEGANDFFKFIKDSYTRINLKCLEFEIFKRDYNIGILLFEPENQETYDNENLTYLRYQNMLSKGHGNYIPNLEKYISALKVGDPVYYQRKKAVINDIDKKNKTVTIYKLDTEEIINSVHFSVLRPRKLTKKKKISELNPVLNKMSTRDLIHIKNNKYCHYDYDYNQNGGVSIDDIKDVLATRENIKSKKRKRQK